MGGKFSSSFGPTVSAGSEAPSVKISKSKSAMETGTKEQQKTAKKPVQKGSKDSSSSKKQPSSKKTPQDEAKTQSVMKTGSVASRQESKDEAMLTPKEKRKKSHVEQEAKKRSQQRDSLSWQDPMNPKDRRRLSSKEAIVPLNSSKFVHEMVKVHNSYRADHGVPKLTMSKELNKEAQERAEKYLLGKNQLDPSCGENTFCTYFTDGFKSVPSAVQVCSEWYEYAANFDFNFQRRFPTKSIKFMQMVWESEKEMGAGRATNGAGRTMIVALYRPKAEMPFSIKQNVKPPLVQLDPRTFQHAHHPNKSTVQV